VSSRPDLHVVDAVESADDDELSPADYEAVADVFRLLRRWKAERDSRRDEIRTHDALAKAR
jgi:hypothetical protein